MARSYRPAALAPRSTVAIAAAWAALSALVAGAAAHALSHVLAPIQLVVPAAVGAAVGGALALVVRRLRLSRPRAVVGLAAAAATAALAVQLAFDYQAARGERARQLDEVFEARAAAGLVEREDLAAEREAWMSGWTLWGFARARIGLDDSGSFTGTPPVLGRTGTLALTGFELLLAMAIAALWAGSAAREPACPRCRAWRTGRLLGGAAHGVAEAAVARLRAGDAAGAAGLLRPPDTREEVTFSLFACPDGHDGDGGVLRVGEVFWTRRRRLALRRVADLEVDGAEVAAIAGGLRSEAGG
jgi:hypothetical protein